MVGVDEWCTKQQADDYFDLVEQKVWHSKSLGLHVVKEVELLHRLRWLDLLRGPDSFDLGTVIEKAMYELTGLWQFGIESPGTLPVPVREKSEELRSNKKKPMK